MRTVSTAATIVLIELVAFTVILASYVASWVSAQTGLNLYAAWAAAWLLALAATAWPWSAMISERQP